MKKTIAILGILALLTLTGCGEKESYDEKQLRLGITCHEAGGQWKQVITADSMGSERVNQFCEFKQEQP